MKKHGPIYIVSFMVLLAALFGSGVTGIYLSASGVLRANDDFLRQRALVRVFALGDPEVMSKAQVADLVRERIDADEVRTDPVTGWRFNLMKVYEDDTHTRLKAYGFPFRGPGFWAPIEGILAVTPDCSHTIGISIVRQSETPGLGGRITESVFTDQFSAGITVSPNPDGACIRISGDAGEGERHVDAITGATQTSMAMDRILNEYLSRFHRAMAAGDISRNSTENL